MNSMGRLRRRSEPTRSASTCAPISKGCSWRVESPRSSSRLCPSSPAAARGPARGPARGAARGPARGPARDPARDPARGAARGAAGLVSGLSCGGTGVSAVAR
ncbi:MAG: hypothetical protein FJ138_10790, partial [Deltaproteobacteria bacterium]|nr:hypothetical protein [Deltaproteobacteria bacterium]